MNQLDFEKLFGTFIEESTEQIEILEQDILNLEKDSGDEKALEVPFRMAHSLKGPTALTVIEKMTNINISL